MSNSIFDSPDGRKSAFMMLYKEQKYDIVEIATRLGINVFTAQNMPNDILGFIRYKNHQFEIVVNNNKKIDEPMTNARIQTTIAHEVAHWIYDYEDLKHGKTFHESVNDVFDNNEKEIRASKVASNIVMGLVQPLV